MGLSISIQSLRIASRVLVRDLNLQCVPGQIVTLMGASGSGKSSLLAAIAGLPVPELQLQGSIELNGHDVSKLPTHQRRIGLLFQDDLLFAHMSVRENLLFATPAGTRAQRMAQVNAALQELGFEGMADRAPHTLSGGQRARVSLMRTLLSQPQALLLDEPFSKLDAHLREQFRQFVFSHARQLKLPTLLVTHDSQDIADPASVVQLPMM